MDQQLLHILLFFAVATVAGIVIFFFRAMRLRRTFFRGLRKDRQYMENGISYLEQIHSIYLRFIEKTTFDLKELSFLDTEKRRKADEATIDEMKEKVEVLKKKITDLNELTAELKASIIESSKEMDMLRTQEKELRNKTSSMKVELDQVMTKLEQLLVDFSSSQEVVQTLNRIKEEILSCQEKIYWYQEKITEINMNYMQLKRVYDALDIEYNQLYEKRNLEDAAQK